MIMTGTEELSKDEDMTMSAQPGAEMQPIESGQESASMEILPNSNPEPPSGIQKYFPNVVVDEANRAELEKATRDLDNIEKFKEISRELRELFGAEPDLAMAINDYREGEDFWVALAKYVDLESIKPSEFEEEQNDRDKRYITNRSARKKRLEDGENAKKTADENWQKSIIAMRKFKEDKKMSDEDWEPFYKAMSDILIASYQGTITEDLLEGIYYRLNRDAELETATKTGEIAMRNSKITDLQDKELSMMEGDGIPDLSGGSSSAKPAAPKKQLFAPRKEFKV